MSQNDGEAQNDMNAARMTRQDSSAKLPQPHFVGRGSHLRPTNRFESISRDSEHSQVEEGDASAGSQRLPTEYFVDDSRSILSENNSPDIPFRYSLNPYRGCAHGCAYCYARPTHEYLGMDAGIDFETKIVVKENAPELLRERLKKKSWEAEPIMFSGVTDCYQPVERDLELTRACIQVAAEFNQPLAIITKNALVTRDIDLLQDMAAKNQARVAVSLTSLDQSLTRQLEPRTSAPQARLRAIRELTEAGIDVTVMTAPIIPGLNEEEIPALLEAAKDHGAKYAGYILLRLPLTVEPVFFEWLERCVPNRVERIKSRILDTRDGKTNQSQFGTRMRGTGVFADHLSDLFHLFCRKFGLERKAPPLDRSKFEVPDGQMRLW